MNIQDYLLEQDNQDWSELLSDWRGLIPETEFTVWLVNRFSCVARGLMLSSSQCYGWKVPPRLGGRYDVDNVEPTDIAVHYKLLADIWNQTKDLPDGTPIGKVVIVD